MKSWRVALGATLVFALAAQASAQSGRFPDPPSSTSKATLPEPQPTSRAPAVAPRPAPTPYTPTAPPRPAATPYAPPAKAPVPAQPVPQYRPPPVATGVVPPSAPPLFAPPVLPYRDGMPIPPGYHLEQHRWRGLILGGLVTFGAAYAYAFASAAVNGFGNGEGWLILPVIGPWAALASRSSPCNIADVPDFNTGKVIVQKCIDDVQAEGVRLTLIAFDGVMQVMGAGLLVAGLVTYQTELVRDDLKLDQRAVRWRVGPRSFGRAGFGLGVDGAF